MTPPPVTASEAAAMAAVVERWAPYARATHAADNTPSADEAIVDAFMRRTATPEGSRPLRRRTP